MFVRSIRHSKTKNKIMNSTFNKLLGKEAGFTYEVKTKFFNVEIHVDYVNQSIEVFYFQGKMLEPTKKEKFISLLGFMGFQSVEEKFNEIVNNL